jgi:hypothetical protein
MSEEKNEMFNSKKIILIFLFILIGINIAAERYYVKPNGNDEDPGTSWNNAFATLSKAAETISNGDEVWTQCGTYKENDLILILEQVKFYGGFMGTETDLSQRDAATSISVVDGNKAHRCFVTRKDSLLDGFHITGGRDNYGGGIYNSGTVSNCTIYMNEAIDNGFGGGLYNNYGTVTSCTLFLNSCDNRGGGLANTGGTVTGCIFYENTSHEGAGFTNYEGTASDCIVYQNVAQYFGGGIVNQTGGKLDRCVVFQNKANVGGGISNEPGAGAISHCTIFQNKGLQGGGIHSADGVITNCAVFLNEAGAGGGIHIDAGEVLNTTLIQNEAVYGGGVDFDGGRAKCCIIRENLDNDVRLTSGILEHCCFGGAPATDGNIDAAPLFEKPWDFHLQDASPCIDAGNPDAFWNDACLPPGKETPRNDMGAFGGPNNCVPISLIIPKEKDYIDYFLLKTDYKPFDLNGNQKRDISDLISLIILK